MDRKNSLSIFCFKHTYRKSFEMDSKLPIYKATVTNEETGVYCISLVDDPAVEKDWLYFNENKKPMTFAVQDEEKRIIRGLIMECDKLIYRRDDSGYEYYITFDAQTIRTLAQKYLKDGFQNNVDTMHNDQLVEGVELVQWFISDKEHGVNPEGFEDVNDHSLYAEFHVLNDEIWDQVKDGTFKGFSLAGIFEPVKVEMNKNKKSDTKKMSKLERIRTALQGILAQFARVSTDKALLEWDGEDDLAVGVKVHGIDEEGNSYDLEDGEYRTDEAIVYVIKEGAVDEIREEEKAEDPAPEESEEEKPEELSAETENTVETEKFSLMHRMAIAFESFLEKEDKIRAGLASKGIEGWLVDAGDDFVVVGVWQEDAMQDKFWKYAVSWDENGDAVIGDGEEVKSAFVPVEEDVEKTPVEDENLSRIAELETELNNAKARIEELENKPAAEPASEEFKNLNKVEKTGNAKIDNLLRRLAK